MGWMTAIWGFLRNRDIAFHLLAVIAVIASALMILLIINGTHARAFDIAHGIHRCALHWSTVIVPLAVVPAAIVCDREQDMVWRQLKLWALGLPLFGFIGYWFSQVLQSNMSPMLMTQ